MSEASLVRVGTWAVEALTSNTVVFVIFTVMLLTVGAYMNNRETRKVKLERMKAKAKGRNKAGENDVVVLHVGPQDSVKSVPSKSPFLIKIETFLKMKNIRYCREYEDPDSVDSGGLVGKSAPISPWVTFRGAKITDSEVAVQHLVDAFNIQEMEEATSEQRSIATAVRIIVEDHLYWCLVLDRWSREAGRQAHKSLPPLPGMPMFLLRMVGQQDAYRSNRSAAQRSQCSGKHPPWKEVETLGLKDLEAVSTFLGEKKFLGVGDEPSQEDCTLFGLSCMILFNAPKNNAYREALKETCSNIFDHFRRMQVRYWPEWKDD